MTVLATFLTGAGAASFGFLAVHTARPLIGALLLGGRREDDRDGESAIAVSRLSAPVSIVVPVSHGTAGLAEAVRALAELSYPEFEIIVVGSADDSIAASLDAEWTLRPMEFFYRRSLPSASVKRFLRGGDDDRLAVVELESGSSLSDRLNAGVNISRYRFVAVIPPHVRFDREALLRALQPALHDPKAIAGVFSHVEDAGGAGSQSRMARIHRLQSIAAQLSSRLSPDEFAGVVGAHGSVTVWRKDALVQAGGFLNVRDPLVDLGGRVQRQIGRVVCTPQSFGWASSADSASRPAVTGRARSTAARASRIAASVLIVSVFSATALGVVSWASAVAVLPLLAFGSALINVAALLVKGGGRRAPQSQELRSLLLVSPLEPFARATDAASVR